MKSRVCFIICTERGSLEKKSLLFARSLRKFGGALADADIHSFAPRAGRDVSSATKTRFQNVGVVHHHFPLNVRFAKFPYANKPLTMAYAERELDHDILVFCDSDQLVLGEPKAVMDCTDTAIKLRPVDLKGIGARDEDDEEFSYWRRLYEICGTNVPQHFVESTVDNQQLLPYWNAGFIPIRRNAGLAAIWSRNYTKVMEEGLAPKAGALYEEQSCLAATLVAEGVQVESLPNSYNYPIQFQEQLIDKYRIDDFAQFTTIHYHRIFDDHAKFNPLDPYLDSSEKSEWIRTQLNATRVYQPSFLRRALQRFGGSR